MLTRRFFAAQFGMAAAARMLPEMAYAQRGLVTGPLAKDMIWLNANENPMGPPRSAMQAMTQVVPESWRYHYQESYPFMQALAHSEGLEIENVVAGAGSSEVLHAAIDTFTSPARPLVTLTPTFEGPPDVARSLGRNVIRVPLTQGYAADVKSVAAEAHKASAGMIYLCNPNNPTSSVTPRRDLEWLVANLPPETVLLLDEAYIHFAETPEMESGVRWVRAGKNVVVTRTFSKIWGMAGVRCGFALAPPELMARMSRNLNNFVSIVAIRAVMAALSDAATVLPERKAAMSRTRRELCAWLDEHELAYIPPQANFIMIDVGRDVRQFASAMPPRGVAVGRPFPPLTNMLRVTIGTDSDMAKFKEVFWSVYRS